MEWAPQKVDDISIGVLARTVSKTLSIFTSVSTLRPYPDLHSTVVVPAESISITSYRRCRLEEREKVSARAMGELIQKVGDI